MKKLICLMVCTLLTVGLSAQSEGGRSPAGERSGRDHVGAGDRAGGGDRSGRSPAGKPSKEDAPKAERGGGDGSKTSTDKTPHADNEHFADPDAGAPTDSDRSRGTHDDMGTGQPHDLEGGPSRAGTVSDGARDAGTASSRDRGTQTEVDKENAKTPRGREENKRWE